MIRIGCCLSINAVSQPETGSETVPPFTKLGFDYIELPLAQMMELSGGDFQELRSKIDAAGVSVETCNNFFPGRLRLTGEEAKPGEALEYVRAAADRAAALGVKIIVLGSSGAKNIPPGFPYERARQQFAELLVKIQDIVAPPGITVALEPLNTKESNFITTVAEGLTLVRELSLKNIKLLADYYHMRMENEDLAVIREAGPCLCHIHIAAKEGRLFPKPGDGEDYGQFFALLKGVDYQGRVSVEGSSKDLAADGAEALKLLRALAGSPG
ncbi:MAG: sugar phosphate isomerase/epimerase [Treponema sp.]|jgi:sugar phosphate isomerase/epimerase|nr:sugar phosphate isomerase/epimerase [Treponema sp.]